MTTEDARSVAAYRSLRDPYRQAPRVASGRKSRA